MLNFWKRGCLIGWFFFLNPAMLYDGRKTCTGFYYFIPHNRITNLELLFILFITRKTEKNSLAYSKILKLAQPKPARKKKCCLDILGTKLYQLLLFFMIKN